MPQQTPTREDLSEKWRPAGFLANRVSAVAVACALESESDSPPFRSARKAWMGDLSWDLRWFEVSSDPVWDVK